VDGVGCVARLAAHAEHIAAVERKPQLCSERRVVIRDQNPY
jgi:hypothetical protein